MTTRVRYSPVLGALLLLSSQAFLHAQEPNKTPSSEGTIRVNVDRVNVGVAVTDSHGHFIGGLHRKDFRVFDNGVEQLLTAFLPVEEPAQLVFLMECGPASFFLGKSQLLAGEALLNSLSPADRVAIVCYSKGPEVFQDFTADKAEVRLALHGLGSAGAFTQLNLSSSLTATLDWLARVPGKKTIVLLSTGIDTSPSTDWRIIQQKLNASDVRILAVSVSGDFRKYAKWRKLSIDEREDRKFVKEVLAEADQSLHEISVATGGHVYFPKNERDFERAYREIGELVRHEYRLEFNPLLLDGKLHTIQVKVKRSWCHVDHRQGYLAPSPASQ